MHKPGFVFVPEPTDEAVDAAMAPHVDEQNGQMTGWYWWGYLVSDLRPGGIGRGRARAERDVRPAAVAR